jgi:chromosome segregation ATPase
MKYIIALLILIPSITFASWWNPTTWFQKEEVIQEIVSEQVAPIQAIEPETEQETKTIIEYRTQVVTDNSSVASLEAQIASLNAQIVTLTAEKNSMYYHLDECQDTTEEVDQTLHNISLKYDRIDEIDEELAQYRIDHNTATVPFEIENPLLQEKQDIYEEIDFLELQLSTY